MKKFIIRPSVGIASKPDGNELLITVYYHSGERRLIAKLPLSQEEDFKRVVSDGVMVDDQQTICADISGDVCDLVKYFLAKKILVNADRDDWLTSSSLDQFDRQLRLISDKLPQNYKPRHIQEKIFKTRIAVVGLGGVGSNIVQQLTAMGFKNYCLIDEDCVEASNLNRQPIYSITDIGLKKTLAAEIWIKQRIPEAMVSTLEMRLDSAIKGNFINSYQPDLIVNCADVPSILHTTGQILLSSDKNTPVLVGGGYYLFKAFAGPFIVPGVTACLACGLKQMTDDFVGNISAVGGNVMAVAALVSSIATSSIMSFMINQDHVSLFDSQVEVDLERLEFRKKVISRNPNCHVCGDIKSHSKSV